MAMSQQSGPLTLISDLVDQIKGEETLTQRKSNTFVTIIGGVVTMLISGAAYLVEHETNLPSWFPLVTTFLGLIGIALKVNVTKNGMTDSTASKLQSALTDRIDLTHLHEVATAQIDPTTEKPFALEKALDLREAAQLILDNINARQ